MNRIFTTFCTLFFTIILTVSLTQNGHTQEKATKEECVQKCKEAADIIKNIGLEEGLKKINDNSGSFKWKDTYVYVVNIDTGRILLHLEKAHLVGKILSGLKDVNGKLFLVEMMSLAKSEKGEGWVSYMWPKPGEREVSPKLTYIYKVPGERAGVCAGIYE